MKMQVSDVAMATNAQWVGEDRWLDAVSIDSRTLPEGALYIAIAGERFDGHDFVQAAIEAGAAAVMVTHDMAVNVPQIIVQDTRQALADLAAAWRSRMPAQVIGITGSNGKTTVKEMIACILKQQGEVLYTQGNLNNELGVPLTLLRLEARHAFAVVEMGANHPGEIAFTSQLAKPDIAVLNNVAPAHLEGFGSLDGVARAKAELLDSLGPDGVAILNRDDAFFDFWKQRAEPHKVLSFACQTMADVQANEIKQHIENGHFVTEFTLQAGDVLFPVTLNLAGMHNVCNALAASAAALALGFDGKQIKQGLAAMRPVNGRLTPIQGEKGCWVIDDSYNANPASVEAALNVLLDSHKTPWVVLGALGEMGDKSAQIHQKLGRLMRDKGVVRLLATGTDAHYTVDAFGEGGDFFSSQTQLIDALLPQITGQESILVKGSRAQRMENVVAALIETNGI